MGAATRGRGAVAFLSKFQKRGARGLIATTFPVPAPFAAQFGQLLLGRYVAGERIGEALWTLRAQALTTNIPLGLFYTLQCDSDIRAARA